MTRIKVLLAATLAGLLALSLLAPAVFAQEAPATGTLVGTVTYGPGESPAPYATVGIEGMKLVVLTDSTGKFTLSDVPAGQSFTIDAYSGPDQSVAVSRYNVVIGPGETLDIGGLNLAVSPGEPTPQAPQVTPNEFWPAA